MIGARARPSSLISGGPVSRLHVAVIGMRGFPADYSGIETAAEHLYPALATLGHEVVVYARPHHAGGHDDVYRGVRVTVVATLPWNAAETLSNAVVSTICALCGRRPDVVHLHALAPALTIPAFRLLGIPTVVTVHGLDWKRAKWKGVGGRILEYAEHFAVRFADEIIVVSSELVEYYWERYRRHTTLVHNPAYSRAVAIEEDVSAVRGLGIEPERYFLYAGRLVPEKRVEDLIVAFGALRAAHKLVVVGDGPPEYVIRLQRLSSCNPNIIYLGRRSHEDVLSLFRHACASVLPSELEGFPMAALESLAQGIPTILSDIPPHREMLSGVPDYDLFFSVGDREQLAACLTKVACESGRCRELGRRARSAVLTTFATSRFVEMTEAVLLRASRKECPR